MKEKIEGIAFVLDVDPSNIQIVVDRIQAEEVLTMQDVRQLSMVGFPVINSLAKVCDKPTSDIMSLIEGGNIDYPIFEKAVNVVYEQFKPAIDELDRRKAWRKEFEDALGALGEAIRTRLKL